MDNVEAKAILDQEELRLKQLSYNALKRFIGGGVDAFERVGPSGVVYQLEVQSFWDDRKGGDLRVRITIDDRGLRAFCPMVRDFLIASDGSFVGEK